MLEIPNLIFILEELNFRDAAARYIFLAAHLIPIAQEVSCKSSGVSRAHAVCGVQGKCARERERRVASARRLRGIYLPRLAVDARWLHEAIFSAQNPVAFSYSPREQNVAALRGVKLIEPISHAN